MNSVGYHGVGGYFPGRAVPPAQRPPPRPPAPPPAMAPAPPAMAAAPNPGPVPFNNPVHQYRYIPRVGVPAHHYAMPVPIPVPTPVPAPQPQPVYFHPYYYPHAYFGHYPMTYPSYSAVPGAPLAAHNPYQPQTLAGSTRHLYYGRTRDEVQRDEEEIRRQTAAAARTATDNFKPAAAPEDQFWVVEADGVTRTLMSFATIDSFTGGRWMMDGTDGIAYYWKGHPVPLG